MEGTACTKAQRHERVGHLGKACERELGLAEGWITGSWRHTKECGLLLRGWEPLALLEVVKPTRQGCRVGVEEARKTICKPKGQGLARDAAGGSAWWV